jgi:hypothetical protein
MKSAIIVSAFAAVPCLLIAWAYTKCVGGDGKTFWTGLAVLLGARLFVALIEMLGSIIAWKLYSRRVVSEYILRVLRTNNFPRRYYDHDDFLNYIWRVENDDASPPSLKHAATAMHMLLAIFEDHGIVIGARVHSASEMALEIYSPRANAPRFSESRDFP